MTKCPKCKFYNICKGRINETVENCVRFKSTEQTNEEWFDSLSTKEKAEWLDKVAVDCCQLCDEERREFCNKSIARDCEFENAEKWELWLKAPHRGDKNEMSIL